VKSGIVRAGEMPMPKMDAFDKALVGCKTDEDLKGFYVYNGCQSVIAKVNLHAGKGAGTSLRDDLQFCRGAAQLVVSYFTDFKDAYDKLQRQTKFKDLSDISVNDFIQSFSTSTNQLAVMNTDNSIGDGHEFTLVKEGEKFALYQANVGPQPHYTLAPALNAGGKDYCRRGLDAKGFKALVESLVKAGSNTEVFGSNLSKCFYARMTGF
jgi:hypothetical protein